MQKVSALRATWSSDVLRLVGRSADGRFSTPSPMKSGKRGAKQQSESTTKPILRSVKMRRHELRNGGKTLNTVPYVSRRTRSGGLLIQSVG